MIMDIFEKCCIKIPNAVFIKEATKTETDDEVVDFLQQYGSISKFERIHDEPDSVFHHSIVVEYNSALVALRPILPYINECDSAEVTCKIFDARDQSAEPRIRGQPDPTAQHASRPSLPAMSHANLNPPEVHRYVVEHIIKNNSTMHPAQHLRAFSGRSPRSTTTDYDQTTTHGVPELNCYYKILQCPTYRVHVGPAADVIKHLRPDTPPTVYVQTIDSAYGTVKDGHERYAKFMDTFQDAGEKPCRYLQRLQVALNQAVKRGGVLNKDFDRHLLPQFCRGCWDNFLITELQ
ncbi:hypothetical protein JOB18_044225 [Solea senegalensis]|uniref:Paraneoplastic antigen Ma-like C-terminal domain-containing protein n=1 Tax=Solea senegalensis TaxID=28829 RepID=A0AAV6SVZ8_SOLSE|nr:hypothetical protein JOB18_044225 [Solea senegalensis]